MEDTKTTSDIQGKMYSLLYEVLECLNEQERKSIIEHINTALFDMQVKNHRVREVKLSFLWDIYNRYSMPELQLIALKQQQNFVKRT